MNVVPSGVMPSVGLGILAREPANAAGKWLMLVKPLIVCVVKPFAKGEAADTRGLAVP